MNKQDYKNELNELTVLRTITQVYSQVASFWMKRTADSVIKSRDYLAEMNQVFITVFSSYTEQLHRIARRKSLFSKGKITFLAHNGKKVAVFMAANSGFYGDILKKTFDLFLNEVRINNYEVTIVGRQGVSLFLSEEPTRPYTFFELSDERIDQNQLVDLVHHLVQYDEIRIYHGKFINFLTQEPVVFLIPSDPYPNLKDGDKKRHFLFEPTIESILIFFEKQIFTSIFEQTIRESQLAKFGSRLQVMDRSGENIKNGIQRLREKQLRFVHQEANKKQLARYSSISLWSN